MLAMPQYLAKANMNHLCSTPTSTQIWWSHLPQELKIKIWIQKIQTTGKPPKTRRDKASKFWVKFLANNKFLVKCRKSKGISWVSIYCLIKYNTTIFQEKQASLPLNYRNNFTLDWYIKEQVYLSVCLAKYSSTVLMLSIHWHLLHAYQKVRDQVDRWEKHIVIYLKSS